jgi:hypothetical protein
MLIDPLQYLLTQPAGTMIYARSSFDGAPMETALYIKEEPKYIKRLKYNPVFELRTGAMEYNGIFLVAVLLQPNADIDMLYESWWNYYQPDGGEIVFRDLVTQDFLRIIFVDEKGNYGKKTGIKNSLKPVFASYIEKIKPFAPWSMEEFNAAKEAVYEKYPSVKLLWDGLRQTH